MLKWCTVPWRIKQVVFSIRVHENCVHRDFQHQGHPLTQPLTGTMTDSLSEISDSCSLYLRHTGLAISLWQRCDDFFLSFLYHTHTHKYCISHWFGAYVALYPRHVYICHNVSTEAEALPRKDKDIFGTLKLFTATIFPAVPLLCFHRAFARVAAL